MEKVNINLLPTEVTVQQRKQAKFNKVQTISIGVLLLLILVASVSVALRIFQSQTLKKMDSQSKLLESQVASFQDQEEKLVVLKNRVNAIAGLLVGPSIDTTMFNLISDSLPAGVTVNSISIDKSGNVILSMLAQNSGSLEEILKGLTSDQIFKKVKSVNIESLSSGGDGVFRLNLKLFIKV